MTGERKPRSIRVDCDLPDDIYNGKWVERKVRITIAEYAQISRLTSRAVRLRLEMMGPLSADREESEEKDETVEMKFDEAEQEERFDELQKQLDTVDGKLRKVYSEIITGWNLEDDFGDLLPDPYHNPEALNPDVLSMGEFQWISGLIQDTLQEIRARAAETVEGKNSSGS